MQQNSFFHKSAFIESHDIGINTKIWHNAHIRKGAKIGNDCVIGKNVYIDENVIIGNKVKIQNNVSIYHGVAIEDGVFIGPHVCFTNDLMPRAIKADGTLKGYSDWKIAKTRIKYGASLGANSTILCGITIGKFAMIGAGSVVTKDVPDYALVYGNPAKLKGYVCKCGFKARKIKNAIKCDRCSLITAL
ncbi:N-acetyltransferase [Candidatus Woesearchaeota archaeon]|nr:N-acetyltransferase [Candidatus Woesearchaeota archaeon]